MSREGIKDGLRRHVNADLTTGTHLTYPDHVSPSGMCSLCTRDGVCEIGKKSHFGRALYPEPFGTGQFGAEKMTATLADLQIVPHLYGNSINFREVKTEAKIGKLHLKVPVVVAAMGSTRVAHEKGKDLAVGAAKAGIGLVVGENIIATYGKECYKDRIKPFFNHWDGKHGGVILQANPVDVRLGALEVGIEQGAQVFELKLGQGAKQNLGGEIKFNSKADAEKYRKLGYHIERNPDGTYQRHSPPGGLDEDDLKKSLLELKDTRLPIWIKIAVGSNLMKFLNFLEKMVKKEKVPIENVTIDGHGGGTGMSPWLIMNETCLPSAAIFSALKKKMSYNIMLAGGIHDGVTMAKAMMLGADGVAMGRPFLICSNVALHPDTIREKMRISGSQAIANFVTAIKEELQLTAATQRIRDINDFSKKRSNLFALSAEAAKMFGVNDDPAKII